MESGRRRDLLRAGGAGPVASAFVSTGSSLFVDSTVVLFSEADFVLNNRHARYNVTTDGQHFLLTRQDEAAAVRLDVILVQGLLGELDAP